MFEPCRQTGRIELNNLTVDPDRHEVLVDGKDIGCTRIEFLLLHKLANAAQFKRVVSHECLGAILEESERAEHVRNALASHFRRIRIKLREADARIRIIPDYNVGYLLEEN